jgi:DNA-binding response OmpR family regulator
MRAAPSILVIEDDRFLRRACEVSLQQRGFAVRSATDGAAGLALARESKPDLILLDLLMPRVSGIEVLQRLRADAETAGIPVVILSNSSREEDKARAADLGAVGYYVKANLSLRALGDAVASLVGSPAVAGKSHA